MKKQEKRAKKPKQSGIVVLHRRIAKLEKMEQERKSSESALRESETFNSALFEYNPIETIVVDCDGRITAFNRAKRHSGDRLPKVGEVMYRDYASRHEIDMHTQLMDCINNKKTKTFPALKYRDKYLHITIAPFPKGAMVISQDVTHSKKAEEALRKSTERYHGLFNGVPVGIYRVKPNGQIMEANAALVQMLGFPDRDSLLAFNIADLYDDLISFVEAQDALKKREFIRDFEVRIFRLDGKPIWVRTTAKAVLDESETVQYFEGMVEDVTERKLAQEALRKSEQEKALILGSLLELVTYQDRHKQIIWANRSVAESFGISSEHLVGRLCYEVWQHRAEPCPGCPMEKILATGQPQHVETTTPDGRVWFKRGYPVRDAAGSITGVVEVALDITQNKKIESEKEKIQDQLLQSQKMEAVGTLAGGIAHDFNNLLTAIHGCVDLSLTRAIHDDVLYKDLKEILVATDRAADLTRQLLLFSRKHPNRSSALNLNQTVDNLLKMLHRLIGEDITITMSLAPDLWTIKADQGTMEQIVVNLAVNARDAMPNGGRLMIKTENVVLDELYCKLVSEARPGYFIRFSISDVGVGMDKETLEHIFEPFFSTKGPGKGTGLGLSVVYGIIKQHDGWINVYSEPGRGSEFKIYFPAVFSESVAPPEKPLPLEKIQGEGERILVVEDETSVREFCKRALEKNGYAVSAVANVEEAVTLFQQENGDFDLLFSDVVLPDSSGLDLISALSGRKQNLHVLLTSGYTDTKSQWKTINEKGYAFLQKPYALVDLLRTVRQALKKE